MVKYTSEKINICGIWIDNVNMAEAVSRIESLIWKRQPSQVVTPNTDHVMIFQKEKEFQGIYSRAALVTADGSPLIWASYFLGTPLKERVTGADLVPELCRLSAEKKYKLFFMTGGSDASIGEKAAEELKKKYPGIQIVGIYYPPFGFEKNPIESARIIEKIKAVSPDMLFVGVGTPKQEKWIARHLDEMGVPVSIGVGASFHFIAGAVRRAPMFMRRCGFEWLWRLFQEPGRLWKRYLVDDVFFFGRVLRQKMKNLHLPTERTK